MAREIKIRASLRNVIKEDLFYDNEQPKINKMIFTRCFKDREKISPYIISDSDQLELDQIYRLWNFRNPLVLTKFNSEEIYSFYLQLRPAAWSDFFKENVAGTKPNVIYYVVYPDDTITGPHEMYEAATIEKEKLTIIKVKKGLNDGILYVPSSEQTFEKIVIQKSA